MAIKLVEKIADIQEISRDARDTGKRVGLVPTMGFLHEGHLSLVRIARSSAGLLVVSVFVNPTQFGQGEDYESYPRDLDRDIRLLGKEGVDVVFAPAVSDMYPSGYSTYVDVENLTSVLCGRTRPGHFRGVTTVVTKLLNTVRPDFAVFGEKDYQQAAVIRRMVVDLDMGVEIILAPTVREKDGLAMSSRNIYLTDEEREDAPVLYQSLLMAKRMVAAGNTDADGVKAAVRRMIGMKDTAAVDYVSVVHPETLKEVDKIDGEAVVAVAVRFGRARLIDNIRVGERS
jgi:pantoate--beta-alanine ligase